MYRVWLSPSANNEGRKLPGVVRQRIKKIIEALAEEPRPYNSIEMRKPIETTWEPRRIRVESWRIIYVVDDAFEEVGVLAIRQRPPYDYEDLPDLLTDIE